MNPAPASPSTATPPGALPAPVPSAAPPLASSATSPAPAPALWALLPCAGTGTRALQPGAVAAALPKQYQSVAGQPLVLHTLAAFAAVPRLRGTLVAVAPGDRFLQARATADAAFFVVDCGGPTRADSVLGGLGALLAQGAQDSDWVLVHDAARCLVTPAQINALIDACLGDSVGGLLAHRLADTLKTASPGPGGVRVAATLERSDKWLAQTPQMFRIGALHEALTRFGAGATDEASVMEALGQRPLLVPGSALNFKVTYLEDFALAQAVLAQRMQSAATSEHPAQARGPASGLPARTLF